VCRVCRIQLRLPAGGTTVMEMNRTDTLSVLRETVAQVSCTISYLCVLLLQWPVGDPHIHSTIGTSVSKPPPSGVAGRNVHLYICLYPTSCCKLFAALMNSLPPRWLAHVEVEVLHLSMPSKCKVHHVVHMSC